MWPLNNKTGIRENKRKVYPYGNRQSSQNYSVWDSMSFIEKFAMITLPIGLTFIDFMITDAIFGLPTWITAIIAIASTLLLMGGLYAVVGYLTDGDM